MTGDQALLCMELAALRVRDRLKRTMPVNSALVGAFDEFASHLAEFANLEQLARKASREAPVCDGSCNVSGGPGCMCGATRVHAAGEGAK